VYIPYKHSIYTPIHTRQGEKWKLVDAVEERTGMKISERTIYALEDASRAPSADIFLALQQVLPELNDPEFIRPIFRNSNMKVMLVEL